MNGGRRSQEANLTESEARLSAALAHRETVPPIDFGGTAVSGMHITIVEELRRHYDLEERPVNLIEPYQMLGEIDNELADCIGIDVVGVPGPKTLFGFGLDRWKEWRTPWEQGILVPEGFVVREDGESLLIYPEGDTSAQASGRMPDGGYFFDSIIRQKPLDDELDPADNLEEFAPISAADLEYYRNAVAEASATGRGIIMALPGGGLGDIAMVPAPFLKDPTGIRDVEEWYVSTITRPDYIHAVFDAQTRIAVDNFKKIYREVGNLPQAVFICGTDFGTQSSTFCSAETFTDLYLPYYRRMNDWIHENTTWRTFKHSCGAVADFIPLFIDAGFDIINPVQLSAAGMDAEDLKREYGSEIVFWGGCVDTQGTLPFGNEGEVSREVEERMGILGAGGGYVANSTHNVQAKTKIENVVAMIEAMRI